MTRDRSRCTPWPSARAVSIATVSRVLSGSTPASALARQRVLRAVEDLEYVPLHAELTRHLLEHGRRRLVFVGDPDASHDILERYRGFLHALTHQRGAEVAEPIRVEYEGTSGWRVMDGLREAQTSVIGA